MSLPNTSYKHDAPTEPFHPVVVLTSCHVIAVLVDGAFAPFDENH